MRRACIDIGSNTTRLLVAECGPHGLLEVDQQRAFTRIGRDVRSHGRITVAKLVEVVAVVAQQIAHARAIGAASVHAVATAAVRRAANAEELVAAIHDRCGLWVEVLSGEQEARLAFRGAVGTLERPTEATLAVIDVGGGSCEVAVGRASDGVRWWRSLELGSGEVADRCLSGDPPRAGEFEAARVLIGEAVEDLQVPAVQEAVAVGGSATSLRRLAGPMLDQRSLMRALTLLANVPGPELARRFALDRERIRLLPAGLLILQAISRRVTVPLHVGRGGMREGVLLEVAR